MVIFSSLIAFVIGIGVGILCRRFSQSGTLHIETTGDGTYLFLEINKEIDRISRKSEVTLAVKASHK